MNATAVVAVVGAISTPVVAIAGYVFNERRSHVDRQAARQLAEDSHDHERQLAEGQREHEAGLRRSERLYAARRETYLDLLRTCLLLVERIELTEPIITTASTPEPPEPPNDDEWRELRARVGAFGSTQVSEAADALYQKAGAFYSAVIGYRLNREHPSGDLPAAAERMTGLRSEVQLTLEDLQALVRDELENL
jgi:hypothetical protein